MLQLVISTNGSFYGHYLRVRRWFGVKDEPAKLGGLCKPCQTMLWGTIVAAILSPLVLIGWATIWGIRSVTGRNLISNGAPLAENVTVGLLAIALTCLAIAITGVLGLGVFNFPDVVAWLKIAGLVCGWYLFACLAGIGMLLCLLGKGMLWLVRFAELWLVRFTEWFPEHWHYLGIAVGCLAIASMIAMICVRLGYDPTYELWIQHKERRLIRKEVRQLRRNQKESWLCVCDCEHRCYGHWCNYCGREKPRCLVIRLWRRLDSRVVAGKMCVAGGFGIAWALLKGLAKGACPVVEFLSPEEVCERARL